jgi:hypothetical protein
MRGSLHARSRGYRRCCKGTEFSEALGKRPCVFRGKPDKFVRARARRICTPFLRIDSKTLPMTLTPIDIPLPSSPTDQENEGERKGIRAAEEPRSQTNTADILRGVAIGIGAIAAIFVIVQGVANLLEKWNSTLATVEMSGEIDQKRPFTVALKIKNPSGYFDMHNPKIGCRIFAVYSDGKDHTGTVGGGTTTPHQIFKIAGGSSAVFYCDVPDRFKLTATETGIVMPLVSGQMTVTLEYETWVPWTIPRITPPAFFTIHNTSDGWRWVPGTEIK